jgi:hypothetical protein
MSENISRYISYRIILLVFAVLSLVSYGMNLLPEASAHISPASCSANNLSVNIAKIPGGTLTGGQTIQYVVTASNSAGGGCDTTGVAITLTTPDGVPHKLCDPTQAGQTPPNCNFPANGSGNTVYPPVSYTVDCTKARITATVTGQGTLHDIAHNQFTITKRVSSDVSCAPGTQLTKTADKSTAKPGDTITYTIKENNTGNVAINNVVVTDSYKGVLGPSERLPDNPGNNDAVLDPGEVWVWNYARIVTAEDCGTLHNNVTATGTVQGTNTAAPPEFAEEDVTVTCSASTILDKTASPASAIITDTTSVNVTYRYNETNDGDVPLTNVSVTDPSCSPLSRLADNPGNNDNILDPGESWFFECVKTFSSPGNYTNVALGTGTAPDGTVVTFPADPDERSEVTVEIDRASTILAKTASPTSGTAPLTVTYTYSETNDGTVPLTNVSVTDSSCSPLSRLADNPGNNDNILDPGESWFFECVNTFNSPGTFSNTATGSAVAPDGTVITYPVDPDERSSAIVTVGGSGVTRTPGYWKIHLAQSNDVWADVVASGNQIQCGEFNVNSTAKLMGGFWSSNTFETDRERRSPLDQARMQLAFHLEAAILNDEAFGSSPDSFGTSLAAAKAAFCGNDRDAMLSAKDDLDAFNNSGTDLPFPDGFVNTNATSRAAYAAADRAFWDQPNLPGPP